MYDERKFTYKWRNYTYMDQTHNDLLGDFQEIGESDILYEQDHMDHPSGVLVLRNVREAPKHLYRFQKHCQNVIEILYPQTNQISIWVNGKEFLIQPKEVFIVNPGTVHSPGSPEGVTHIDTYIILADENAFKFSEKNYSFKECVIPYGAVQESLDLMIDAYEHGNEMQLTGSLMYFLGTLKKEGYLNESKLVIEKRMIRVLNYVEDNYQDCNLSPYHIASLENISYSHFIREFKSAMGISFKNYLTQLRLNYSLKDLRYTNLSITDIAMKNGFADVQALIRACHKKLGMSPSNYRERFL